MKKERSKNMTKARGQPFCRATNSTLGYFDGVRVFPRSVTHRNNALFFYNNHFCLIWKSGKVSFNQAIRELKENFKIVDNFRTEEKFNSDCKYEFIPEKRDSHLTNFFVYDLETHKIDRAGPYCISFYRLSKLAGLYDRNLTPDEVDKCKKGTFLFDGDKCISIALAFCLKLKGEPRKTKKKLSNTIFNFMLTTAVVSIRGL